MASKTENRKLKSTITLSNQYKDFFHIELLYKYKVYFVICMNIFSCSIYSQRYMKLNLKYSLSYQIHLLFIRNIFKKSYFKLSQHICKFLFVYTKKKIQSIFFSFQVFGFIFLNIFKSTKLQFRDVKPNYRLGVFYRIRFKY